MFELETAIENWKHTFGNNEAVGSEEASELEEHLRELMFELGKGGLSQREAFMVGADRLGHPSELAQEYGKVNVAAQWRRRSFWMVTGHVAMTVLGTLVSAMVMTTGAGMAMAGIGGTISGVVINAVMVLAWIGLPLLAYRMIHRLDGSWERLDLRWLLGAAGAVLVFVPIVTVAAQATAFRFVEASWMGEYAFYLTIGRGAIYLCIVAICLVALKKLYEPAVSAVD